MIVGCLMVLYRSCSSIIEDHSWLFLLEIGTCYSVWRGGLFSGLFSLLLSSVSSMAFFLPLKFPLQNSSKDDLIGLFMYIVLGMIIIGFGVKVRLERDRVIVRENELLALKQQLLEVNVQLKEVLERRTQDLQEIRDFIAEEVI